MSATTTFLDANVVLYAAGAPHRHRDACVAVLRQIAEGRVHAVVDTEVLQEILHVCARRGQAAKGISLVRDTMRACAETIAVTAEDISEACVLVASLPGLPVRDAVHAAVMRGRRIREIVSVDPDFDRVPGIRRIPPEDIAGEPE